MNVASACWNEKSSNVIRFTQCRYGMSESDCSDFMQHERQWNAQGIIYYLTDRASDHHY